MKVWGQVKNGNIKKRNNTSADIKMKAIQKRLPHISNDTTIFACHASIWARLTHEYAHHLRLTAATHSVVIFLKLAIFCFLNDFKGTVKFVNLSLLLTSVEQKFQKILHCVYCLSCTFVLYLSLTIISNTLSSFAVETKRPLTSFLGF